MSEYDYNHVNNRVLKEDRYAVISLILGLAGGVFSILIIPPVVGLVFGRIGLGASKKNMARFGIGLNTFNLVIGLFILVSILTGAMAKRQLAERKEEELIEQQQIVTKEEISSHEVDLKPFASVDGSVSFQYDANTWCEEVSPQIGQLALIFNKESGEYGDGVMVCLKHEERVTKKMFVYFLKDTYSSNTDYGNVVEDVWLINEKEYPVISYDFADAKRYSVVVYVKDGLQYEVVLNVSNRKEDEGVKAFQTVLSTMFYDGWK